MLIQRLVTPLTLSLVLLFPVITDAESTEIVDLEIREAWARASTGRTETAAAFLTIRNKSEDTDRLIAARSDHAQAVELHTHIHEDGVMRMRQVDAIALPANSTIEMAPGGDHVMLFNLKTPLEKGQTFPLTLTFDKAGNVKVEVEVLSVGASGPDNK